MTQYFKQHQKQETLLAAHCSPLLGGGTLQLVAACCHPIKPSITHSPPD
jgi:hypothetical protein